MKPVLQRLFICLSFALLLAACAKHRGPANGKSVQPNNNLDTLVGFNALINRLGWQTTSTYGYLVHQAGNDSGATNLLINAYGDNNGVTNNFNFTIVNFIGPGTYNVAPPLVSAVYYVGKARHNGTSGQIIVTSNTPYGLVGTFSFVADTFSITNGAFNVAQP